MKCESCGNSEGTRVDNDVVLCETCYKNIGIGWTRITRGLHRQREKSIKKALVEKIKRDKEKKDDK